MMGEHSGNQDRLFYSFNLDEHVPADHLLRGIDRFLDLADLCQHLAPFYSHTGRPSVDPELMVMVALGYFGLERLLRSRPTAQATRASFLAQPPFRADAKTVTDQQHPHHKRCQRHQHSSSARVRDATTSGRHGNSCWIA